jgi:hypothetical protein
MSGASLRPRKRNCAGTVAAMGEGVGMGVGVGVGVGVGEIVGEGVGEGLTTSRRGEISQPAIASSMMKSATTIHFL